MYFTRKKSVVELHSSKTIFWWHSSNLAIFSCEINVAFDSRNMIEGSKKFQLVIKVKNKFFLNCIYFVFYRSSLNENLFSNKYIAMPITLEFSKHYMSLTLNYSNQSSKI